MQKPALKIICEHCIFPFKKNVLNDRIYGCKRHKANKIYQCDEIVPGQINTKMIKKENIFTQRHGTHSR